MENNTPPTVFTIESVVGLNERRPLTDLFSVIDPDPNSEVLTYQIRDNGLLGGSILEGNNPLDPLVWHTIDARFIGAHTYRGDSTFGSETYSIRVFDGVFWSNFETGRITSGNETPELVGQPGRVASLAEIRIDQFFTYSDADGDAPLGYYLVDRSVDGGVFILDGVEQAEASFFYVQPNLLPFVTYKGAPTAPQSELVGMMVYDGYSWSPVEEILMTTTDEPRIFGTNESILAGEMRPATDFFNATDADGDSIGLYFVNDYFFNSTDPAQDDSGYWLFKGERQAAANFFVVTAAEIDQLFWVGAADGPVDELVGVQVWDGFQVSDIENFVIRTVVPPEVSGRDISIQAGHFLNMSTGGIGNQQGLNPDGTSPVLNFFDSDGADIEIIGLVDRFSNSTGGAFYRNGERLESAKWHFFQASELSEIEYGGAAFGPQFENIGAMVFANGIWSDVAEFRFDTLENQFAPELTALSATARLGTSIRFSTLFSWTDADGDLLEQINIYDTGLADGSGFFTRDGTELPAGQWHEVAYEDREKIRYNFPTSASSEIVRYQATDGTNFSTIESATMIANPTPTIVTVDNDVSLDHLESVAAGSLFTQTDGGLPLSRYEVYDEVVTPGQADRSGRLFLRDAGAGNNGEQLQGGVVHTLTAEQFSRLEFQGAESDFGRSLDPILVRATNDVTGWTEWHRINVNTDPVGADSLTTGFSWFNAGVEPGTADTVITYTFIDGNGGHIIMPDYYICGPSNDIECDEMGNGPDSNPLSQPQRETMREIFDFVERFTYLDFVEIPPVAGNDPATATIVIGGANAVPAGIAAWAYLPNGDTEDGEFSKSGDIWFDHDFYNPDDPVLGRDVGLGSSFRTTAYHEVGHALGLDHPFESQEPLSIFMDFSYNTLMSYTDDNIHNPLGSHPETQSTFSLYDIVELQRLYGVRTDYRTGNDHYGNLITGSDPHFVDNNETHQTTIFDSGGIDTLNYTHHTADETIDLREGTFSSINGVDMSLRISYETIFENARGGEGNDRITGNEISNLIFGNDGNDTLIGNGGNDFLRGGSGNDTYVYSRGDGRDSITDAGDVVNVDPTIDTGTDTILVFDATGSTNAFDDDMVFRRLGNDLRIDLTTDQEAAQGSIVIKNFNAPENQVELLAIHDRNGQQVGNQLDLLSIWATATDVSTRYMITDNVGENGGFLGVPV